MRHNGLGAEGTWTKTYNSAASPISGFQHEGTKAQNKPVLLVCSCFGNQFVIGDHPDFKLNANGTAFGSGANNRQHLGVWFKNVDQACENGL